MNIFLIPYTGIRHLQMGLWCGGTGLLTWLVVLHFVVLRGPVWPPEWDGPLLLGSVATMVAGASVFGEGNLLRRPLWKRTSITLLAMVLTAVFTLIWYNLWHLVEATIIFANDTENAADASLVSLRYRIGAYAMGGFSCALGPMIARKLSGWFNHLIGGLAAGLSAAAAWHALNSSLYNDLYLAGAGMAFTWGFTYGVFAWGIPDSLYAGWLRVLSPARHGRRVPIDPVGTVAKERFVGHFPRGLDLFLSVEDGVQELHVSVRVGKGQRYFARGLSLYPTRVKRFLERVDLRYDPRRPAPLETRLSSGDRIELGNGEASAELEFIMLPREER